jgi:hypothetical protein
VRPQQAHGVIAFHAGNIANLPASFHALAFCEDRPGAAEAAPGAIRPVTRKT